MASIGSASLTIVPKFDNLGRSVTSALNSASGSSESAGAALGGAASKGMGKGFLKAGAIAGAAAMAVSSAVGMVTSSVGSAVSRLDTLNRYPKTMQTLGYSAEVAQKSIDTMGNHLKGLPTALDAMAGTVQGIVAITGDLDKSTDVGLALNDMLVASGASTQMSSAAMEQFRQILAKGKPEMQDWKSLTQAMPGQMAQLAQAMLGPTASANDLYAALGGGKNKQTITMDQLMDKMVELDKEGGKGITNFAEQAQTASGGIQTSMSNMRTAIARGIANIMDGIGAENISAVISGFGKAFETGLSGIGGFIKDVREQADLTPVMETFKGMGDTIKEALGGIDISSMVKGVASGIEGIASGLAGAWQNMTSYLKDNGVDVELESLVDHIGSIASAVGAVLSFVAPIVGTLLGVIVSAAAQVGNLLATTIDEVLQIPSVISSSFDQFRTDLGAGLNNIATILNEGWTTAFNGVTTIVPAIFSIVISHVTFIPRQIIGLFLGIGGKVSKNFSSIPGGVKGVFNNVISFVTGIPGKIVSKFLGLGSKITSAIGSIHFPQPSITWESLKVGTVNLGNVIPHVTWAADGGIFGPNAPKLLGLGDNTMYDEAAIPLSPSVLGGIGEGIAKTMKGSGDTYNVTMTVSGAENPEEWAQRFVAGLRRQKRVMA